ncbi:hypothetical protein [Candidatus Borrarchaeum sp.]|uniref:hypothetical protein n=1 Tax=Candidatus Borrarchaeum sp. TaxID=2846742 RepID=UPI002580E79A|nr:hypothetical protein [Candidatus Borrarchaeum sp.]
MEKTFRRVLMGLLVVCLACLIASTSTIVIAEPNWGTLSIGNEIQWQSNSYGTIKMKVINVEGKTITLEVTVSGNTHTEILDADASITELNLAYVSPWLLPKSYLEEDLSLTTQNYEFEGVSYTAYYSESSRSYRDTNTGILFESRSPDGTITDRLVSTDAYMAVSTVSIGCLGTLFIPLVSVTALVSYSLIRLRKKEVV